MAFDVGQLRQSRRVLAGADSEPFLRQLQSGDAIADVHGVVHVAFDLEQLHGCRRLRAWPDAVAIRVRRLRHRYEKTNLHRVVYVGKLGGV